jgi:hypothetical protein
MIASRPRPARRREEERAQMPGPLTAAEAEA